MSDLYEADIAAWAEQQADALRRRAANEIDWENVAEEIEDVARRDRNRIYGALLTAIRPDALPRPKPDWRGYRRRARGPSSKCSIMHSGRLR